MSYKKNLSEEIPHRLTDTFAEGKVYRTKEKPIEKKEEIKEKPKEEIKEKPKKGRMIRIIYQRELDKILKFLKGEKLPMRIGILYKRYPVGMSYKTFQRRILSLCVRGDIIVKKVYGGKQGCTTTIERLRDANAAIHKKDEIPARNKANQL